MPIDPVRVDTGIHLNMAAVAVHEECDDRLE